MSILGVPVSLVNLPDTVTAVTQWARGGEPRTIFVREVASLMLAVENRKLRDLHDQASLLLLLWSHLLGFERESLTCQYSEHRMTRIIN
jgi:hypothetical protein